MAKKNSIISQADGKTNLQGVLSGNYQFKNGGDVIQLKGRRRNNCDVKHHIRNIDCRKYAMKLAAIYVLEALKQSGLKQKDLADALGLSPSRISDIVNSRRKSDGSYPGINLSLLCEISRITGVDFIEFTNAKRQKKK